MWSEFQGVFKRTKQDAKEALQHNNFCVRKEKKHGTKETQEANEIDYLKEREQGDAKDGEKPGAFLIYLFFIVLMFKPY